MQYYMDLTWAFVEAESEKLIKDGGAWTWSPTPCWLRGLWPSQGKFPVTFWFQRINFVLCLHRNCVVQGVPPTQESLCEASSCTLPPLFFTSLYLSVLTPSFSLSLPIIPNVAHEVTAFLCKAAGVAWTPSPPPAPVQKCFSVLGSPFSTPPHRESPCREALRSIWWVVALVP